MNLPLHPSELALFALAALVVVVLTRGLNMIRYVIRYEMGSVLAVLAVRIALPERR